MKIGDDEYKRELKKYLDERKPKKFENMIESMSWYTKTSKEFRKLVESGEFVNRKPKDGST